MKKLLFVISIYALGVASAFAAKDFVAEKNVQKVVNKAPKSAKAWPEMKPVLKEDLSDAKLSVADWTLQNGEISNAKNGANLTFKKLDGQCAIMFEFSADEDAEGFIFVRAPKGDVEKAVKIKLAGVNKSDDAKGMIGSIDGVIKPREKFDDTKGQRWLNVKIFVEGDNIRISKQNRINSNYADRNYLTYSFDEISKKRGSEVAKDGECGIVVSSGKIKFKNVYITQF